MMILINGEEHRGSAVLEVQASSYILEAVGAPGFEPLDGSCFFDDEPFDIFGTTIEFDLATEEAAYCDFLFEAVG